MDSILDKAKVRGAAGEQEWLEFKTNIGESHASITYDGVGEYLSGLANAACVKDVAYAYLILGVEDGTWNVCGTNLRMDGAKWKNQNYEIWLRKGLNPSLGFVIEEFDYRDDLRRHVVIFTIPAASGEPVAFYGKEFFRIGSNLTQLRGYPDCVRRIYNSATDWSANIVEGATIDDLDPKAIAAAREHFASKHEEFREEMESWSDITFLNKAKITRQGKITNAAIVLLGRPESEALISPAVAKIRWILKDQNDTERDYQIVSCPFVLTAETIYGRIRNLKYRFIPPSPTTLFPEEMDTYEPYVIREALNNAIAHQDYSMSGMINVVEYDDRLVFSNKGHFIPESVQKVLAADAPEERYRNRFLAQAMVELKMVDTIGSGIRRMFAFQRRRLFPMPDYDLSGDRVQLTITGKVIDDNYATLLAQRPELTLDDIEILSRVLMGRKVSPSEIDRMKARRLVEGRKPNVYISKVVAQSIGKKAAYTKNKGLDNKYYRDLVLQALHQHGQLGRKEIEELLIGKLPDALNHSQKISKVGNLLTRLRKDGLIQRAPGKKWILSEVKSAKSSKIGDFNPESQV
ncbi:MAG: putative DNA binding domain-containing protein [Fibrobacterales bacterium]|nr:putative DNA binding domain-containing protein [Fibrobacterales bacterium]